MRFGSARLGLRSVCRGNAAITLTLIVLYVAAQIALAVWAGRGAKSDADYLVAGRSLGPFAVGMSLFATWFASESLIATSSEVARAGLAGAAAFWAGESVGRGLCVTAKIFGKVDSCRCARVCAYPCVRVCTREIRL